MSRTRTAVAASSAALLAATMVAAAATPALAAPSGKGTDNRTNNTSEKLRQAASAEGGYEHLLAFQDIADDNGGTRASGTPGYDASVDYVVERLTAAGYVPEVQDFTFPFFEEISTVATIDGAPLTTGAFTFSGSGDIVDGKIVPVDVDIPPTAPPGETDSGCEDADFAGLDFSGTDDVALIQRGLCPFGDKALNAQEAGAEAVVIFNEGQTGRTDTIVGTLGGVGVTIPVIGASYADGVRLASGDVVLSLAVETVSENRLTQNVIAQTSGRTDNVVVVGAHLDSVVEGPGINDNGSGSAGILEVAEAFAKTSPENAVRFTWWGAEELGLLGSEYYVSQLTEAQQADIALYLNFDMIASPNFARMVYDGDDSDAVGEPAGPEGSAQIEEVFTDFFSAVGLNSKGTDFSGRSDYGPFIEVGIPSGGLFTGAEGIASQGDNTLFGSEVGAPYDPNYHEVGDTIDNLDLTVFEQNIDAIAHAVIVYSSSTETVNGEAGQSGAGLTTVKGPGGGIAAGEGEYEGGDLGGGGLRAGHADHADERDAA